MKLKEAIKINNTVISNRLVMAPVATRCSQGGFVNEDILKHYHERTRGGYFGLVILEHQCVSLEGRCTDKMMGVWDDKFMPGLKSIADTVHENGSPIIMQINHGGRVCSEDITGLKPIEPDTMTLEEIAALRDAYVKAALRAESMGYDGVEVHSAHGYMLNQFYSPLVNHRSDDYGGSLENRIRLHLEILKAIRAAVRPDFILSIRLGGCDYEEGGTTIEDSVKACAEFEKAGADLIDISGGMCGYLIGRSEPGFFREITEAVRPAVEVPVILTGGVNTGDQAEALLQEDAADMIGVARAVLADPKWAEKNMAIS